MATFNKELKWVITEYGKRRVTELLSNPEEKVCISVMQVGDDNSGNPEDREYQDQLGSGNGKLFHQVGANIPIYEKGVSDVLSNHVLPTFIQLFPTRLCSFLQFLACLLFCLLHEVEYLLYVFF